MRMVALVIALICGIAVLVGVFLPWASASFSILGFPISISLTGWEIMDTSSWDISEFVLPNNIYAMLALIGGIVISICAFAAMIISGVGKAARPAIMPLGIVLSLAALTAIGGSVWFVVDMMNADAGDYIGYGVYVSAGAALLALISGAIAMKKS